MHRTVGHLVLIPVYHTESLAFKRITMKSQTFGGRIPKMPFPFCDLEQHQEGSRARVHYPDV